METINGEFIMKGCDAGDPDCLHSIDGLVDLVKKSGFIPLFSNEIPGFSVEEHTPASSWWTDEDTDPWRWRQIASGHPDIAYGKFFNRSAGFISKEWFPVFANYRRNGYDFDALYDDELASNKSKKIMDVFEMDEESAGKYLLSSELRELAGKDETTLMQLQMQTYLIITDFQQRKNRKGAGYGWHLAVYGTPETKWGRSHVTSDYKTDPAESWNKIASQMEKLYPGVSEKQVLKYLGIQWPGEVPSEKKPRKRVVKERVIRTPELPWPENLIKEIGIDRVFPETKEYRELSSDQKAGLDQALDTLLEREQLVIRLRYEKHRTLKKTGDEIGRSSETVRLIIAKGIRKLRYPSRLVCYSVEYQQSVDRYNRKMQESGKEEDEEQQLERLRGINIEECAFSTSIENALLRAGCSTLGQLVRVVKQDPKMLIQVRNIGWKSLEEVLRTIEEYGIEIGSSPAGTC